MGKNLFCSVVALVSLMTVSQAQAALQMDFSGYVRSGVLFGKGYGSGEGHGAGFALRDRLQENQFFELSSTTHLSPTSRFVITLGSDGDTTHYTDQWWKDGFSVRNLYFELTKLPANENVSLWFGSRMYRGDDIYLFNTWPFDNHNFLGGGASFRGPVELEFAFGTKKDATYFAGSDAVTFSANRSQRYIFVQKSYIPVAGGKRLKTNLEVQLLPSVSGTYTGGTAGATPTSVKVPSDTGVVAGLQYDLIGSSRWFATYGWGNVIGAMYAEASHVGSLETAAGTLITDSQLRTRKGARSFQMGVFDGKDFPELSTGLLYALVLQGRKTPDGSNGLAISSAVRPKFYVTDNLHFGVEFDVYHYLEKRNAGDVSYAQISPMLEFALNKSPWGTPKFRLIGSQAFYSRDVMKYGEATRQARTVNLGFEIWF